MPICFLKLFSNFQCKSTFWDFFSQFIIPLFIHTFFKRYTFFYFDFIQMGQDIFRQYLLVTWLWVTWSWEMISFLLLFFLAVGFELHSTYPILYFQQALIYYFITSGAYEIYTAKLALIALGLLYISLWPIAIETVPLKRQGMLLSTYWSLGFCNFLNLIACK